MRNLAVGAVLLGLLLAVPATAGPSRSPCGVLNDRPCGTAVETQEDDFVIDVVNEDRIVDGGGASVAEPVGAGGRPVVVGERNFVLACAGNSPDSGNNFCPSAEAVCAAPEQSAYWLFTRTRNRITGETSPWIRQASPPYVCRAPNDPEVQAPEPPIEILIRIELERDFASLPLPRGEVAVRPNGDTLVNVETRFSTPTTTQALAPRTILGRSVTVTAIAQRYDWVMGDGTTYDDAGPGTESAPIRHVYRQRGEVRPFVRITWGGSFTVEGIPGSFDVTGTATTESEPVPLQVRAASAELVDGT